MYLTKTSLISAASIAFAASAYGTSAPVDKQHVEQLNARCVSSFSDEKGYEVIECEAYYHGSMIAFTQTLNEEMPMTRAAHELVRREGHTGHDDTCVATTVTVETIPDFCITDAPTPPAPVVPAEPTPDAPDVPDADDAPDVPDVDDAPDVEVPAVVDVPDVPDVDDVDDVDDVPDEEGPDVVVVPDAPDAETDAPPAPAETEEEIVVTTETETEITPVATVVDEDDEDEDDDDDVAVVDGDDDEDEDVADEEADESAGGGASVRVYSALLSLAVVFVTMAVN